MSRSLARPLAVLLCLVALCLGGWTALFAFYRVPGGAAVAWSTASAASFVIALALAGIVLRRPVWTAPLAASFAGALLAFGLMQPRNDRKWAPDVSHPVTATIEGDVVSLHDVRVFDWRTETDFTPRWEDRRYELSRLETLDIVNSYWTGPVIAHTLVSFGFGDDRYLTVSIEIRREQGEAYSALAGFFRQYERVTVGADERDIVFLRSNVRREDPEIYRIKATPAQVRALFVEVMKRADIVADHPAWYNSLTANCTTELFGAARKVDPSLPFDWRIIASGYLPDYLYDQGLLDTRVPFSVLKSGAAFKDRALAVGDGPDFSRAIRAGMPDPNR